MIACVQENFWEGSSPSASALGPCPPYYKSILRRTWCLKDLPLPAGVWGTRNSGALSCEFFDSGPVLPGNHGGFDSWGFGEGKIHRLCLVVRT